MEKERKREKGRVPSCWFVFCKIASDSLSPVPVSSRGDKDPSPSPAAPKDVISRKLGLDVEVGLKPSSP